MKSLMTKYSLLSIVLITLFLLPGCDNNDPVKEDVPEMITEVTLVFTADQGSTTVSVSATDPDADGPMDMVVEYPVDLIKSKTYTLNILLTNGLADPASDEHDISDEVAEEGTEHMIYFGWTNSLFASPAGSGNIDNRSGAVNYLGGSDSNDSNGLPLGLTTTWTTRPATGTGTFRILLKHQPGLKSNTSGSDVGETDLDVTFDIVLH
jgi:hypothetical protein